MPKEKIHSLRFVVNSQKGILPLFFLIAIGVAVVVGGTYLIRNEFVKTGKSGKAEVDKVKVQKQIGNTNPLPSLTPAPKTDIQYGAFVYKPPTSSTTVVPEDREPSFSINAPSDWGRSGQSDNVIKVKFEAPEEDQEVAGEDLQATNKAKVQVNMIKGNSQGSLESLVDYYVKSSGAEWEKLTVNSKSKSKLSGQDAYKLEIDAFKKGVSFRTLSYVLVKGKYGIVIYGGALKSAWDKREPEIYSSLNSFKLSD
ncbi:hypothetical protein HYW46_00085 [Candidatus Daviesbacteria bacterium]|nr:hypothetical protein [Candidatus Daviesbacteria bacterium]